MKLKSVNLLGLLAELDQSVNANPIKEAAPSPTQEAANFVLFRCGEETMGVPVGSVAAVLHEPSLCRLPHSPAWLRGAFYWGGDVVPLLASSVLSTPEVEHSPARSLRRCLVLVSGTMKLGLRVDEVIGVRELIPGRSESSEAYAPADAKGQSIGLSEALRWRPVTDDSDGPAQHPKSRAQRQEEGAGETDEASEGSEQVDQEQTPSIRVVSVVGLLASEEITQYANPGALEMALAGGSAVQPYGGQTRE